MQTGDAELEMRGRCSAGQKVSDDMNWLDFSLLHYLFVTNSKITLFTITLDFGPSVLMSVLVIKYIILVTGSCFTYYTVGTC